MKKVRKIVSFDNIHIYIVNYYTFILKSPHDRFVAIRSAVILRIRRIPMRIFWAFIYIYIWYEMSKCTNAAADSSRKSLGESFVCFFFLSLNWWFFFFDLKINHAIYRHISVIGVFMRFSGKVTNKRRLYISVYVPLGGAQEKARVANGRIIINGVPRSSTV